MILIFTLCSCTQTIKSYQVTLICEQEAQIIKVNDNISLKKYIDDNYSNKNICGWYLKDELYNFDCVLSSNITLVAKLNVVVNKYNPTNYDGNNRVIKIYHSGSFCYDPFDDFYEYSDKEPRQKHQEEIEKAYNIQIEYEERTAYDYDELAIIVFDLFRSKVTEYELNKFYELDERFANKNSILTAQVGNYGYANPQYDQELLLFYSQQEIDILGLEDPLTLWYEGKWTVSYFNEYITKLVSSDAYKSLSSLHPVFSGKILELFKGFSAASGEMLVPSLDNVNVASDTNVKIMKQLKTYIDSGYIDNTLFGIFNAFYTNDICVSGVGYSEDDVVKAVPFPINDDEVDLLLTGNLSDANYKVATTPSLGVYFIPNIEDEENLTKEILENILYDLIAQYDGPRLYYEASSASNYAKYDYDEFIKVTNQIKSNRCYEYYIYLDDSTQLTDDFKYSVLKKHEKEKMNLLLEDLHLRCQDFISKNFQNTSNNKKD